MNLAQKLFEEQKAHIYEQQINIINIKYKDDIKHAHI